MMRIIPGPQMDLPFSGPVEFVGKGLEVVPGLGVVSGRALWYSTSGG